MATYIAGEQIRAGEVCYIHPTDGKAYRGFHVWNFTARNNAEPGDEVHIHYPESDEPLITSPPAPAAAPAPAPR